MPLSMRVNDICTCVTHLHPGPDEACRGYDFLVVLKKKSNNQFTEDLKKSKVKLYIRRFIRRRCFAWFKIYQNWRDGTPYYGVRRIQEFLKEGA